MTDEPIIIRHHGAAKMALAVLFSPMLAGLGAWAMVQPDRTIVTISVAGFLMISGVAAIVLGIAQIRHPTFLVMRAEDFEQTGFWRQPPIPWGDISEIVYYREPLKSGGATHVGCRLTDGGLQRHARPWHGIFVSSRYDIWIMSGHGAHITKVIRLLREHHQRAVDPSLM